MDDWMHFPMMGAAPVTSEQSLHASISMTKTIAIL
jgi:hypothetical protein